METQTPRRASGTTTLVILIPLAVTAAALIASPADYTLHAAMRGAAMLGYMYVFLACLSSAFVLELTRRLGKPYLKVHHLLATIGLTLLTIHGTLVAWDSGSIAVFLPRLESPEHFLLWGGPPALWLIWIAVVAAALRLSIGARWRVIHWLNYIAFMLATAHGLMIGSDLTHPVPRYVASAMALIVIAVFFRKRLMETKT